MISPERLESKIQALVEVTLSNLLPGKKDEDRIIQKIAVAMREQLQTGEEGATYAPNIYLLVSNPSYTSEWNTNPRILEELAKAIFAAGSEAGWLFHSHPAVNTAIDANLAIGEIHVVTSFSSPAIAETQATPLDQPDTEPPPSNAFLIQQGTKVIPLDKSLINIGRRLDNHIVIDDPRVSRNHAQIRVIKGRFVIFDLKSTGGTYVNGQRTSQIILYPGDVISLAGVTLVFGQDIPTKLLKKEAPTGPSPASGDRTTAVIKKDDIPPSE
jgi:hypothetical protein